MLFHSIEFLVFFLLLLLGLLAIQQQNPRKGLLLIASYIFYMWWNPVFILLIIFSTFIDYFLGKRLYEEDRPTKKRFYLILSLCSNLGLLAFFKYYGFFEQNLMALMQLFGHTPGWTSLHVILPVGISFYTFQTMSYTIDIYRGELKPTDSMLDFAVFVSFFPQLVAGPIVRASDFLPQLRHNPPIRFKQESVLLVLKGLGKKVLIADNLGVLTEGVFSNPEVYPSPIIWLATICFSIQIYCDFSGYTDIAIGIADILGYHFPQNFNRPYFAASPSDFWRRWHISLSTWLRDYLYISLGGNRKGKFFTYRNLFLTMALGGLWHGNSWNYVIWGVLHGLILILYRLFDLDKKIARLPNGIPRLLSVLIMQYIVLLTWIAFRVKDFDKMLISIQKYIWFDFNFAFQNIGLGKLNFFSTILILLAFWAVHTFSFVKGGLEKQWANLPLAPFALVIFLSSLLMYLFWPLDETPFIYFQF
ncbi:MAG: MBOAT family O-acyltransferase [Bacteroidota bacterium]